MPVPGPRTQERPLPGYTNPTREIPDRINLWKRPGAVMEPGRSPGLMMISVRGNILAAGTVRRLWRQTADYLGAQPAYSWTLNAPAPGRPVTWPPGLDITRALRYMARSLYIQGGTDNTRLSNLHTKVGQRAHHKPVTIGAGGSRNRPTVRNRMTSFGSRVPALNSRSGAAMTGGGGGGEDS